MSGRTRGLEVNESREKVVVQRLDVMALQVNIEELVLVRVGSCCSCQFVWFVWFVWFVSVRVGSCRFVFFLMARVVRVGSCRFVSLVSIRDTHISCLCSLVSVCDTLCQFVSVRSDITQHTNVFLDRVLDRHTYIN